MTDKDLKKLSRAQLLEMLLVQTREVERLREKLTKAETLLSDRYMKYVDAGNLAEAMVKVNGVMEAAQAAAQQYLDNITEMEQDVREYCRRQLTQAAEDAGAIRSASSPEEAAMLYQTMLEKYNGERHI